MDIFVYFEWFYMAVYTVELSLRFFRPPQRSSIHRNRAGRKSNQSPNEVLEIRNSWTPTAPLELATREKISRVDDADKKMLTY